MYNKQVGVKLGLPSHIVDALVKEYESYLDLEDRYYSNYNSDMLYELIEKVIDNLQLQQL